MEECHDLRTYTHTYVPCWPAMCPWQLVEVQGTGSSASIGQHARCVGAMQPPVAAHYMLSQAGTAAVDMPARQPGESTAATHTFVNSQLFQSVRKQETQQQRAPVQCMAESHTHGMRMAQQTQHVCICIPVTGTNTTNQTNQVLANDSMAQDRCLRSREPCCCHIIIRHTKSRHVTTPNIPTTPTTPDRHTSPQKPTKTWHAEARRQANTCGAAQTPSKQHKSYRNPTPCTLQVHAHTHNLCL